MRAYATVMLTMIAGHIMAAYSGFFDSGLAIGLGVGFSAGFILFYRGEND